LEENEVVVSVETKIGGNVIEVVPVNRGVELTEIKYQ
jgi:hypothetical protein